MSDFKLLELIDKDMGWKNIVAELKLINGAYVKVGVLSNAGEYPKGGVNLADVATFNEFGTADGKIPSRPFMRTAFDSNLKEMEAFVGERYGDIVDGKKKVRECLKEIGVLFKGKTQAIFTEGHFQANSPYTIAIKNHAKITAAKATLSSAQKKSAKGKDLTEKQFSKVLGAKETLATGGNATPLIDTGRLRQSIDFEVVMR